MMKKLNSLIISGLLLAFSTTTFAKVIYYNYIITNNSPSPITCGIDWNPISPKSYRQYGVGALSKPQVICNDDIGNICAFSVYTDQKHNSAQTVLGTVECRKSSDGTLFTFKK